MQEGKHILEKDRNPLSFTRKRKGPKGSLKAPIQGVTLVLLSVILFLMWLGAMVVLAKFIFG